MTEKINALLLIGFTIANNVKRMRSIIDSSDEIWDLAYETIKWADNFENLASIVSLVFWVALF